MNWERDFLELQDDLLEGMQIYKSAQECLRLARTRRNAYERVTFSALCCENSVRVDPPTYDEVSANEASDSLLSHLRLSFPSHAPSDVVNAVRNRGLRKDTFESNMNCLHAPHTTSMEPQGTTAMPANTRAPQCTSLYCLNPRNVGSPDEKVINTTEQSTISHPTLEKGHQSTSKSTSQHISTFPLPLQPHDPTKPCVKTPHLNWKSSAVHKTAPQEDPYTFVRHTVSSKLKLHKSSARSKSVLPLHPLGAASCTRRAKSIETIDKKRIRRDKSSLNKNSDSISGPAEVLSVDPNEPMTHQIFQGMDENQATISSYLEQTLSAVSPNQSYLTPVTSAKIPLYGDSRVAYESATTSSSVKFEGETHGRREEGANPKHFVDETTFLPSRPSHSLGEDSVAPTMHSGQIEHSFSPKDKEGLTMEKVVVFVRSFALELINELMQSHDNAQGKNSAGVFPQPNSSIHNAMCTKETENAAPPSSRAIKDSTIAYPEILPPPEPIFTSEKSTPSDSNSYETRSEEKLLNAHEQLKSATRNEVSSVLARSSLHEQPISTSSVPTPLRKIPYYPKPVKSGSNTAPIASHETSHSCRYCNSKCVLNNQNSQCEREVTICYVLPPCQTTAAFSVPALHSSDPMNPISSHISQPPDRQKMQNMSVSQTVTLPTMSTLCFPNESLASNCKLAGRNAIGGRYRNVGLMPYSFPSLSKSPRGLDSPTKNPMSNGCAQNANFIPQLPAHNNPVYLRYPIEPIIYLNRGPHEESIVGKKIHLCTSNIESTSNGGSFFMNEVKPMFWESCDSHVGLAPSRELVYPVNTPLGPDQTDENICNGCNAAGFANCRCIRQGLGVSVLPDNSNTQKSSQKLREKEQLLNEQLSSGNILKTVESLFENLY